ncbi:MAG: hypothetical protein J7539_12740 [Niabella sp.]|nr:hypothetical protein [Niabella sp.]
MYLDGHTSVAIYTASGAFLLKTFSEVKVENDGHTLGSSCEITVPLNCYIQPVDKSVTSQKLILPWGSPRQLFKVGDRVFIKAQYTTSLIDEKGAEHIGTEYPEQDLFEGFIYDFVEGQPMKIKCLDYSYFFKMGIFGTQRILVPVNKRPAAKHWKFTQTVGSSFKSITFKDLVQKVVDFVNNTINSTVPDAENITLMNPKQMPDIQLVNITFAMSTPYSVLEYFRKELGFNITLFGTELYANVASFTMDRVAYDTSRNVTRVDLQQSGSIFNDLYVKAYFLRANGTIDSITAGNTSGKMYEVKFLTVTKNGQPDLNLYNTLAHNALVQIKQRRFRGTITTLLYPQPQIFAQCPYNDVRYPDRSNTYVCTGYTTTINENGYRNEVKLSALYSQINVTSDG